MKALESILRQKDAGGSGIATLTTKAMCLTCGRDSITRVAPYAHLQIPAMSTSLTSNTSPGPDIMHAGFRLPVQKSLQTVSVDLDLEGSEEDAAAVSAAAASAVPLDLRRAHSTGTAILYSIAHDSRWLLILCVQAISLKLSPRVLCAW